MSDEFDFDSFDDPALDFDLSMDPTAEPKDDRKPITRVADTFASGVRDTLTDSTVVAGVVKRALPTGYRKGLEQADKLASNLNTVYNDSATTIRPAIKEFKKAAQRQVHKVKGILPESIYNRLEKSLEVKEERSSMSAEEVDNNMVSAELSKIFELQKSDDLKARDEALN